MASYLNIIWKVSDYYRDTLMFHWTMIMGGWDALGAIFMSQSRDVGNEDLSEYANSEHFSKRTAVFFSVPWRVYFKRTMNG